MLANLFLAEMFTKKASNEMTLYFPVLHALLWLTKYGNISRKNIVWTCINMDRRTDT